MADNANKEIKTATADDGSTGYEMKIGLGTIAHADLGDGHGLGAPVQPLGNSYGHVRRGAGSERWRLHRCFDGRGPHEHGRAVLRRHHVRYGQGRDVKKLKLTPAIALGGLMIGMSLACYVTSTLLTTISNAVLFIYIGPVVCVVLARIFRNLTANALRHGAAAPVIEQRGGCVRSRTSWPIRRRSTSTACSSALSRRRRPIECGAASAWPSSRSWLPPWEPPSPLLSRGGASA